MVAHLIQTKLHPPYVSEDLIERPELLQRLSQSSDRQFMLISAPAGYGKTTLIASWLRTQQQLFAWFSLDKFDNDLNTFLQYVVAAIQGVFPEAFPDLSRILQAPDSPTVDELSATIVNELNQLPERLVLVLDDCHVIQNTSILQLVGRILDHPPSRFHLVMISRTDPLLPLPRLRLKLNMSEVREQDLRFSDQEADHFLRTSIPYQLDRERVKLLNQRVEGWVAGLKLASLSLQHPNRLETLFHASQMGAQDFTVNYLFSEVLAGQPTGIQEFLLQTAFVDRFCAELCRGLVRFSAEGSSVQEIITHLLRVNLFVIPLDEIGRWYRYHHSFQQMLRQKASSQLGLETISRLRGQAGDWFADEDLVDEALDQYQAAGDTDAAIALVEANSRNLLNRLERRRLEHWMNLLPDETIWQRPRLLVAKAWLLYRHWRLKSLESVLDQLQHCLSQNATGLTTAEREFILGQMNALQSATLFYADEPKKSVVAADKALASLPITEQGAIGTAMAYAGLSLQALGDGETAVSRLQQALDDPAPHGPAPTQLYLALSFIHWTSGNLAAMGQTVERFMALTKKSQWETAPVCWVSGIYHYELNQLDEAQRTFEEVVSLHYSTNFLAACDSWLALARICQVRRDLVQAQAHLTDVRAEALRLENRDLLAVIDAAQAYQWLLQGETTEALRWAESFDPSQTPDWTPLTVTPLMFWVRVLIAQGKSHELRFVQRTLKAKIDHAQSRHFSRQALQLLTHQALVHMKRGEGDLALRSLDNAVRLGRPGRFVRSFVDAGPALKPLLEKLQLQGHSLRYLNELIASYSQSGRAKVPLSIESQEMATLLTLRETEILQMLQDGLSNAEIAQELVISLYTVKRHASNIYRKLGVKGRRQAVYKAQQMGILTLE